MQTSIGFHKIHLIFLPLLRQSNLNQEGLTDNEIILRYKQTRDQELVGELFKRYTRFVFLVCMKYLKEEEQAKDAAMQVFEALFEKLKKHDIQHFKPWLHSVVKNHCLTLLRKKKTEPVFQEEFYRGFPDPVESEYVLHLSDEKESMLTKLESAILSLSKEQQTCIELFYLKKMCYQEVAAKTGYTDKQVKSYIQNGKRNLRLMLEQHDR
ncbi:MAG: sigma-70 family RNA polymerase sigma factor [Bacteroidales bacterium]|nr:sigma-70 family RNA polymerase sigma factor [Bacteroidales bacterium]